METVSDFIFLGSKINADGDCSHKIKRCLLFGRITNLDSVLKSRDITLTTKIKASSPITPWQTHGEKVETVSDFIFLGSKINANGDCSHEIKRCLLLGRKAMTNLDSVFKIETLLCQQMSV